MPGRRVDDGLQVGHSWVWTADAERRWVRAFRLLLTPEPAEHGAQAREGHCQLNALPLLIGRQEVY